MGAYSFRYWSNEAGADTIILVHGFTGNGESWREVAEKIGSRRKVVSVDLPGHDGTTPPSAEEGGFEGAVDDLAVAIRSANLQRSHLVGYSLGGRVCLGLMAHHPDLVRSATLIGTHPGLRTKKEREERAAFDKKWIDILENQGIEAFVDTWEKLPLFETQSAADPRLLEKQRVSRLSHSPESLAASLRTLGLARMPDYRDALRKRDLPVHLVVGGEDTKFLALAKEMCNWLKDGSVTIVPGVGHNIVLEAPARLAESILTFCDRGEG